MPGSEALAFGELISGFCSFISCRATKHRSRIALFIVSERVPN
jgi:hypothetical protein